MTGNVIQSFLVGLGFEVDDASLAKFNKSVAGAALKVTAMYVSVKTAAAGIFYGISKISEGFENLGYEFRLIAPAINRVLKLRGAMIDAYRAAGIDIKKAAQQSVLFNFSLAKTKFALDAIYKSVGLKFIPLLTKQMDNFRKQIYANMPKIQQALERFISFVFKAFEATSILGSRLWSILERVYDIFKSLHEATHGWSTVVLGVVAAWKYLNLAFLATPLGMILTGLTALLALWDDFKTFKEGGQSLINWGSDATRAIVGLIAVVATLGTTLGAVLLTVRAFSLAVSAWQTISAIITILKGLNTVLGITDILALALEAPFLAIAAAIGALITALTLADAKWQIFGGKLSGFFSGVGAKILDFVGGSPNVAANVNTVTSPSLPNPIGSNVQNNSTQQNVNQATNIIVQGSADANATGKAVASQQNRVNFDMTRNMRGATR